MFLLEIKNANTLIESDLEAQWAGEVFAACVTCWKECVVLAQLCIDTNLWTQQKWRDVRNLVPSYFEGNRRNGLFNDAGGKPNSGCVAFVQCYVCHPAVFV